MIDTLKMTVVNQINESPAASQVKLCERIVSFLNSK